MNLLRMQCLAALLLALPCPQEALGERISFDTRTAWQQWKVPVDAVDFTLDGRVVPLPVRKNVNAVLDAEQFGGGVRRAGSNSGAAPRIMDGDLSTGWAPAPADKLEDWWIEIDLGRLVSAEAVRIHFTEDGQPLEFFNVLLSSGEQFFTNALVPIDGTLAFNFSQRIGFNKKRSIDLDFTQGSVRIIRIEASQKTENASIAEVEVRTIGDNLSLGLVERGGSIELITDLQEVLAGAERMVDGDIVTNWAMQTFHQTQTGKDVFNRIIFDLGAHFWIDRVRIIGEPAGAPTRLRNSYGNFFWYQIMASDGSLAPDGSLLWHEIAFLEDRPENQTEIRNFDHSFPLQKIRYIKHFFPSTQSGGGREGTHGNFRNFALVSEYQIYGEGVPPELRLTSPILDLQGLKGLTSVDWEVDTPPTTRLEVRTRTGNETVEVKRFFDKRGKEITESKWDKTPSSLRGPVETSVTIGSDWSLWSEPYTRSGEFFKSPTPRRFAQIEVRLISDDPSAAPSISSLHLNIENPIAMQTRGEVFPRQVEPGVSREFTYFILPTFGNTSQGFDRLTLTSSVPVEFTGLRIGGEGVAAQARQTESGFSVELPSLVRTEQLVQLSFRSTIYQNRTRFDVFLGNSQLGDKVRQLVDEGNASQNVDSESISVSLPVNADLLTNISLSPLVLTPNGDGAGDRIRLEFDALKLVTPRPIRVHVYDLAGRQMRELSSAPGLAQRYSFTWDGRDGSGQMVSPGTYLLRIEIEGDSRTETVQRLLPVAY